MVKIFLLTLFLAGKLMASPQVSVQFVVDENYLAIQTIAKSESKARGLYSDDVEAYRAVAKSIDSKAFLKIQNIYQKKGMKILFSKIDSEFKPYAVKLRTTEEFSKILQQTKQYAMQSEGEWNSNLVLTSKLMRDLTGFNFSKTAYIYISHPAVGTGTTWDIQKFNISFGAWPAWDSYFTVYVWHELLHLHMPLDAKSHAIIQLATDCWLREKLNRMPYPPLEGHPELFPEMEKLMPSWEKYLENPTGLLNYYYESTDYNFGR